MSPAYIKRERALASGPDRVRSLPLIKLFNEKLSDLRRNSFREAHDDQKLKDVLKGTAGCCSKSRTPDPNRMNQNVLDKALTECLLAGILPQRRVAQLWQQPNWRAVGSS